MKIEKIMEKIAKTEYWDAKIFNIQFWSFGEELCLFIEDTSESCWKITFLSCLKTDYETDANWRSKNFKFLEYVKNMTRGQLSYWGQDISLEEYPNDVGFIKCHLDLSTIFMEIICKDVVVEAVARETMPFFWENN